MITNEEFCGNIFLIYFVLREHKFEFIAMRADPSANRSEHFEMNLKKPSGRRKPCFGMKAHYLEMIDEAEKELTISWPACHRFRSLSKP